MPLCTMAKFVCQAVFHGSGQQIVGACCFLQFEHVASCSLSTLVLQCMGWQVMNLIARVSIWIPLEAKHHPQSTGVQSTSSKVIAGVCGVCRCCATSTLSATA